MAVPRFKRWRNRDCFADWICAEWEPRVLDSRTQPTSRTGIDFTDVAKSGPGAIHVSQVYRSGLVKLSRITCSLFWSPFFCGLNSVLLFFHVPLNRTSVTHSLWLLIVPPHILKRQGPLIHRRRMLGVRPWAFLHPEPLFPHREDVGVPWNNSEALGTQPRS